MRDLILFLMMCCLIGVPDTFKAFAGAFIFCVAWLVLERRTKDKVEKTLDHNQPSKWQIRLKEMEKIQAERKAKQSNDTL